MTDAAARSPHRVQLRHRKGWRMPPNTVSVARPTKFGNPYRIGMLGVGDSADAVELFRAALRRADLDDDHVRFMFTSERIRFYLRGKNLACWCPLDQPCHADVLLEIAND